MDAVRGGQAIDTPEVSNKGAFLGRLGPQERIAVGFSGAVHGEGQKESVIKQFFHHNGGQIV